jgi:serine-type D-Ala-D-Ala carboxypeptidase/endopeptidase (penicillin-binding protein 4)
MPQDDPGASEGLAIEDPADFAAQLFRQLLEKRGIVVYGHQRTRHTELANLSTFTATSIANGGGTSDANSLKPFVLASYESDPLGEDLMVINKVSQNLHAEIMLRLLGREKGTAGTIEGGLEVLHGFLTQAGIDPGEYTFNDGSGLSRQNLVTPHALVQVLMYARQQPWGEQYRASLPVAGVDGSLAERFKGTPLQGRVHAKTGSLEHVNSLSGYVDMADGHALAFAILVNNHNATSRRTLELIDQVVTAFAGEHASKEKDKKKK